MLKPLEAAPGELYKNLRKIAMIDVGSNSFRLIVITYVPGYHFQVTDEVREAVRLVQGLGVTGLLRAAPMDRDLEICAPIRSSVRRQCSSAEKSNGWCR